MALISKTKFLEFKSAKSPSGSDWFYVKRTNDTLNRDSAVVITTLVKNNDSYDFLFLKTSRPPITAEFKAKFCLESPAGLIADINKSETMLDSAKKELLEEAGLVADELFIELTNSSTSAGLSSETLAYVTAIVNNPYEASKPVSDGGIIVDRIFVKTDEVLNYFNSLDKEVSLAAPTVCGAYFALNRLKQI